MSSGVPRATLGSLVVGDACPVAIIGVLNVSPESFYGGSIHTEPDDLVRAADAMVAAGAGILDVGGMSTAPYLPTRISEAEESDRLARAVGRLATKYEVPISVDTFRSGPARAALDAGAAIVNDVTGLRGDPDMAALVVARGAGLILMAHRAPGGLPTAGRRAPIEAVSRALVESLALARGAGIADERIVLDPGIGFIRDGHLPWYEWDAAIIAHLDELRALGRPVCVGVSRKSFIGALAGRDRPAERLAGSLAATAVAVRHGAALIRTHDVAESRDAVRVASALRP
jgi:dihydropteroate synthase